MVRIVQIALHDFKNIAFGEIAFTKSKPGSAFVPGADVIGIYGQNGSGKTSVIEAIDLVKTLMTGAAYDGQKVLDYFYPGKDSFSIDIEFNIDTADELFLTFYTVTFSRRAASVWISHEKMAVKQFNVDIDKWGSKRTLVELVQEAPESAAAVLPKNRWFHLLNADQQLKMSMLVSLGVLQRGNMSPMLSIQTVKYLISLFVCDLNLYMQEEPPEQLQINEAVYELQSASFKSAHQEILTPLYYLLAELGLFFRYRVNVFTTLANATCSLNVLSMDIIDDRVFGQKGHLSVNLFKPAVIKDDDFPAVSSAIKRVSGLIGTLVPGLSIEVKVIGSQLLDKGDSPAKQVEFLSCRNGVEIPLRCESEGVRKLISFSLCLMEVHSYSDAFLAIDELDSGVFEFLLGQLLSVLESFGKGQLLFTAHNLRVLELLPASEILLTTADPDNRFVRFKGVKPTNNMRDQYLRAISLGDSGQRLYDSTDRYSIDAALCLDGDE